ncbi:uncharacterized protein [Diabrotica undecimpunctata]|uniref:uncharacterized protein n=1 Tax=Diabrotica undecimpunctata TaxID=50387 RepID=UPI003B6356E7
MINNGTILKYSSNPKYLGVTLDRTLTFKQHLENTSAKIKTRNNIIQKLANTSWGSNAKVIRTSALSLVYPTAEYCAPVWLNSHHTNVIDTQLNQTMRHITGTIKPTPTQWLPILNNIAPPATRRLAALNTLVQTCQQNPALPINTDIAELDQRELRLKSRHPPTRTATRLADFTTKEHWMGEWNPEIRNANLIENPIIKPDGFSLPRREWCNLNRIRVGHGVCNKSLKKWGINASPGCDKCSAVEQTTNYIVFECPATKFVGSLQQIHQLTPKARDWLRGCNLRL